MKQKFLIASIICFLIAGLVARGFCSSETTNLGLSKPAKGDLNWGPTINNNMDLLDQAYGNYVTTADNLPQVYVFSDTFNYTTGTTITLPNEVDAVTEYSVSVIPTSRAGAIGDIYVTKTTTNFVVKCSENNTTDTFAAVVYYIGDVSNYGGSIYRRWYVSPDSSITDHGNASTTGSLAWVAAQISSSPAVIEMPGNKTYQIKQNVTLADNILYHPQPGAIINTDFSIRDSNYQWNLSGSGTGEYYLQASGGGNPNINQPATVIEDSSRMTEGSAGSLAVGEWDWGNNDSLGYSTIYVRITGSGDPDSEAADYIEAAYQITINSKFKAELYQTFSGLGYTYFGPASVKKVYPEWWGSGDDTLSRAVESIKGSVGSLSGVTEGVTVQLSENTYTLSTALKIGSGIIIKGVGHQSNIEEAGTFSGDDLIQLVAYSSTYCSNAKIINVLLTTTSANAIKAIATNITECLFENIFLDAVDGLILDTYTQNCEIHKISSYGSIDHVLYLKGNFNSIKNITKEGATGSAVGEYILIENHASGKSTGNYLEHILIEGTTSANKCAMKIDGGQNTTIRNFWFEKTSSDGYAIKIENCYSFTRFAGILKYLGTNYVLKLVDSQGVLIDYFDADSFNVKFSDYVEIDSTSHLTIDHLYSRYGENVYKIEDQLEDRVTINRLTNRTLALSPVTGHIPYLQQHYLIPQNLFYNPSFEAGRAGWSFSVNPTDTEEYIASTISAGLMGHFKWTSSGSYYIQQTISVPSSWIGRTMTVSALVKIIYFKGVSALADCYADEMWLSFGGEGIINPARFASLNLGQGGTNYGGNNVTYGSAAPTAGTWNQGDIVFNTGAAASGTIGWVCTTAGSPGTWKTFGTISP